MSKAFASLSTDDDRFDFLVDPYEVTWGHTLRTQTTDTYGGKVIQVLGVALTTLNIEVVAGSGDGKPGGGFRYVTKLMDFFVKMCIWSQTNELPAKFSFPALKMELQVWGKNIDFQDQVGNVVYPISMQFEIEDDLGGNIKKSEMRKELAKLNDGVGYVRTPYNYPSNEDIKGFDAAASEAAAAAAASAGTGGSGSENSGLGAGGAFNLNPSGTIEGLTAEQAANAAAVVSVAQQRSLGKQGAVIGVMVAMTESTLKNVGHGDAPGPSSRGLFQQMPSWGSESVRMDPKGSAGLFYDRMVGVSGWQGMDAWLVAQEVQGSEFYGVGNPGYDPIRYPWTAGKERGANYKEHYDFAVKAVNGLTTASAPATTAAGSSRGVQALNHARQWIGKPYVWGGGDANGPTGGGFDCSGLTLNAYASVGIGLSHYTQAQWDECKITVPTGQAQPGDLMFFSDNGAPSGIHHVAIYIDNLSYLEAQQSGVPVKVTTKTRADLIGIKRPG